MASTKDIHDIMGMGGGPVQKPAKKKKKVVETQPRLSGISREVQALMGDSVPPVQIVETPKYKNKPSLAAKLYKPRHWEERVFTPGARSDGLILRHWKRALPQQVHVQPDNDVEMSSEITKPEYQFEEEFPMEKWDVNIRVPQYTDELYEKHFQVDDWTREETDYLIRLASDYDLRWVLIADRYDPQELQSQHPENKAYSPRTMEQLKLRYYQVAAQDLEIRTPKSTMNPSEFALFEKMRNFDAKTETLRKTMAEKLFERTKDEAEEERTLLEELHRITKNEEDFISMRRDLYARLEAAPSLRRNERGEEQNIILSSAGLSDLLSRLFAKEKHMKRRLPAPGEANASQQAPESRARSNTQVSRRDILETPTESKKGAVTQPQQKQLSKADEEKYGVSHPTERLTSGVSFRHEKINRVTTAKSQVQTQKINAALTELEIPARLSMPTDKVCKGFERLVAQIQLLLDARKTLTRVSEEVKTLEEMRRQRLGLPGPNEQSENQTSDQNTQPPAIANHETETSKIEVEGEPGPAVDEDDDDAEAEDDVENTNVEETQVDEDEDTRVNDESKNDDDDEEEEGEDDDDDEEEEEEEEDEEDDDEGTAALRRGAENDDEEDVSEDDEKEDHPDPIVEEDDEEEEEEEDEEEDEDAAPTHPDADSDDDDEEDEEEEEGNETQDVTMDEVEPAANDPDAEEEEVEESRPTSAAGRGHKRGASVVSDASGAGSNRSGIGRKRKR